VCAWAQHTSRGFPQGFPSQVTGLVKFISYRVSQNWCGRHFALVTRCSRWEGIPMGEEPGAAIESTLVVFRVRRRNDAAIADLASAPLDEATAAQMRTVLASHDLAEAHRVLAGGPRRRPDLRVVAEDGGAS